MTAPMSRARRRCSGERAFTLVELMVVVMIIAILMAIAIPTFLTSRRRAQDSATRSNVRSALSAAQAVYAETQSYTGVNTTTLGAEEPSLTFVINTVASSSPKSISVKVAGTDTIYLTAQSDSGKCWALRHIAAVGGGTSQASFDGTCSADGAAATGVTYTAL